MPKFISLDIRTYSGGNRVALFIMEDEDGLWYRDSIELGKETS